ncbi:MULTISPECIES: ABC transporter ATP-binding protein [unclassified Microbacterium]|uniref:ABC transporter ATP-binding protein n=1 Tax=unclassified Microbacterium TaxID=2609290 RepID=UPI00214B65AB|nr:MULTISPECIES: ATP-binding cassette domain-containing protein [unclassified Microbacterium]MCR2799632.1 ATP-binding cassette domain-containing protein [Microbacterium sp. zg.Y818]MCR2827112.1 ATP-binding cassette domain-containing protein [Microbacterium sp. zg.Y909]WIM21623.1 ATP-binding cassette domain-containing protein [Microbacterium sp. zg-Y818]
MIRVQSLTKRYGRKVAVHGIDFTVEPGRVTGFLGPNGAGKSTTMRMIVGLDRPTSGTAEVNGRAYRDLPAPLREVGVLLDARAAHRRRTAYKHLLAIAATHRIGAARVHQVIELTGLDTVAGKRVGGFSLGMGQRLGIAAALLGDPQTIILDEPVNGLDPEGILWIRGLLRELAAQGRTVLLSSHLMSEMTQTADHLIVIGQGRILADGPMREVVAGATRSAVRVRTRDVDRLIAAIAAPEVTVSTRHDGALDITSLTAEQVADAAAASGVVLYEITTVEGSLEDAYLSLTAGAVEYRSAPVAGEGADR